MLLLLGFLLPLAPCAEGLGDQDFLGKVPSLGWQWGGCGVGAASPLPWHGRDSEGWLAGGLAGCVPPAGLAAARGGLPSAENVTCHRDRMEVEFSRELGNYSWHVCVVGTYCCCPGPSC